MNASKTSEYAFITGASNGIGFELAKLLAENGFNLIMVSRNQARLERAAVEIRSLYDIDVRFYPADLTVTEEVVEVFRKTKQERFDVRVLVNNAGFGNYGLFEETDFTTEQEMIRLNIMALTHLTKLFLPDMTARGEGKILNIASMAGFIPTPYMAVYAATKAYIISFGQALACELKDEGVSVTTYCPGDVATGFQKAAGLSGAKLRFGMTAREAASTAMVEMMKGARVSVPDEFSFIRDILPKAQFMDERFAMLSPERLFG